MIAVRIAPDMPMAVVGLNVHVRGPLVFNTIYLLRDASLAGFGLAYLPVDQVREHIDRDRLVSVLDDWCPKLSGYHLYYPNRKLPASPQ